MVDLAVPRDIESSVSDLDDVYLYTVDDLEGVIQDNIQARQEAANEAESIIKPLVASYWQWLEGQKKHDTVRDLHKKYQQIAGQELQRAKSQLQNNPSAEDALDELTHRLLKKFMHHPLVWLREDNHSESDNDQLLRQIFRLDDES